MTEKKTGGFVSSDNIRLGDDAPETVIPKNISDAIASYESSDESWNRIQYLIKYDWWIKLGRPNNLKPTI